MSEQSTNLNALQLTLGRSWWLLLIFGVLSVLFGLLAIFDPLRAGAGITWAVGLLALAEGVISLIGLFKKTSPLSNGWAIAYAVISILFGVLAMVNPVSMAASMALVAGVWFLIAGVLRIVMAVRLRKSIGNEWSLILGGVLAIVLGLLLVTTPVAGLIVAVIWMGVALLVYGLLQIFAAFRVRKLVRG